MGTNGGGGDGGGGSIGAVDAFAAQRLLQYGWLKSCLSDGFACCCSRSLANAPADLDSRHSASATFTSF